MHKYFKTVTYAQKQIIIMLMQLNHTGCNDDINMDHCEVQEILSSLYGHSEVYRKL